MKNVKRQFLYPKLRKTFEPANQPDFVKILKPRTSNPILKIIFLSNHPTKYFHFSAYTILIHKNGSQKNGIYKMGSYGFKRLFDEQQSKPQALNPKPREKFEPADQPGVNSQKVITISYPYK